MRKDSLSEQALQSLNFINALYRRPIYRNCDYNEDGTVKNVAKFKPTIKVAIVGFNDGGKLFLDTVLQVGQMPGRTLDVTVYSPDIDKKSVSYLAKRPALTDFFDVNESSTKDSYGHIAFKQSRWKDKSKTAVEFFEELDQMDYVLFSEDEKEDVEKEVNSIFKENTLKYKPILLKSHYEKDIDFSKNKHFSELERMAFNSHLVWENTLETNIKNAKNKFKKEYNYVSSLTYALSIKYKLHAAGIEIDFEDINQAAEKFAEIVNRCDAGIKKEEKIIAELAAAEHRRWVTEKICAGWQQLMLSDISADIQCNKGKNANKFKNHHYCIAKGGIDNPLARWTGGDWDGGKPINGLDDLDKASVMTHRKYRKNALVLQKKIDNLFAKIENNNEIVSLPEYKDWKACVNLITQSNAKKVGLPYNNAFNRLINKTNSLKIDNEIVERLNQINQEFAYVIKSREYENQKQKDIELVKKIPFILTFKANLKLSCEFMHGDNSKLFANVSVLKKFNPKSIVYFCEYYNGIENDIKHFFDCIKDYKWLRRSGISFAFGYWPEEEKTLNDLIENIDYKINATKYLYDDYYDYISCVCENNIATATDAVIFNNQILGYNLRKAKIPCGLYQYSEGTFDRQSDILLRAVNFYLCMTIQDILRINGAEGSKRSVPVHLESAYGIYAGSKENWKRVCRSLSQSPDCSSELKKDITNININRTLTQLQNIGFIKIESLNNIKTLRFRDRFVKSLLIQEGKMLEIHIYNQCVASGFFDDAATGYTIKWENGMVTNEFDLLLTKGLKSALVEVKTTSDFPETSGLGLKQEYYEKLDSLVRKFGINSYGFLINDGISTSNVKEGNKAQIDRGNQLGIKTILSNKINTVAEIISNDMRKI
ncbi:MAG: hypothetical protein IJK60_11070 [Clostridia bacterium]|nr:hypothetical protein [Clostridia bacterium]